MPTQDDRIIAALIYGTSLFFPLLGPVLLWLWKKDGSSFVDYHGKEYFNFLISYTIYGVAASLSMFILIGFILAPIVGIMAFVFTIIAIVKAYQGEEYRFPLIIHFIK